MAGTTRLMRHVKRPKQQQTLDAMFGKRPISPAVPETTKAESNKDEDEDEDEDLPIRSRGRRANKGPHWSDLPVPDGMSSPRRLRSSPGPRAARRRVLEDEDEEEEEEEEEDEGKDIVVIDDNVDSDEDVRPAKRRRQGPKGVVAVDSSEDELVMATPAKQMTTPSRAAGSRSARKSARSVRQRHMELLRRRRQGEKVMESDLVSSSSSDEEPALYDTDPELAVLSEFEDEEEEEGVEGEGGEEAASTKRQGKKEKEKKGKEKKEKKGNKKGKKKEAGNVLVGDYDSDDQINSIYREDDEDNGLLPLDAVENEEEDMDDFIDDSHAGLLGEPDADMLRHEIPLQFTSQAHKPLKSHFKDAVEWLVHRRLDPGGTQHEDEVYRVAWDRLDREVGGLAQSRFLSSIWTPEFLAALQARPYMESFSKASNQELDRCHACNRDRHPATFRVVFSGSAYDSKTLEDIEDDDEDDDDDDEEDSDDGSVDMHGNKIPPLAKEWELGAVCHSNAETAHDLLHWRRALKDWVEKKLTRDGQLQPARLQERDRMRRRQRQALVHSVVDGWETNGTIKSLYGDFSRMLEEARVKSNKTTRYGR